MSEKIPTNSKGTEGEDPTLSERNDEEINKINWETGKTKSEEAEEQGNAMDYLIKETEKNGKEFVQSGAELDEKKLEEEWEKRQVKFEEQSSKTEDSSETTPINEGEATTTERSDENKEEDVLRPLNDARRIYAEEYIKIIGVESGKYNRMKKIRAALGLRTEPEETPELKIKKENYLKEIRNSRNKMYDEAEKEVNEKKIPEKKKTELLEEKMREIAKATIVLEANYLYNQKKDLELEAKGEDGKKEKMMKFAGKVIEGYRKMPLSKKLLISAGLLTGGLAAGFAGGATGAALGAGVISLKTLQKTLGGAATAVGLEGLIKRRQEKRDEKETIKLVNGLMDNIKNSDARLDEKLFELEGGKGKQKFKRYAVAGLAGAFVGSGLAGKAFMGLIPDSAREWATTKLGGVIDWAGDKSGPESGIGIQSVEPGATETIDIKVPGEESIVDFDNNANTEFSFESEVDGKEVITDAQAKLGEYTVEKGDNLWDILRESMPEIKELEGKGMKRNVIANLIKEIEGNPKEYGIESGKVGSLKVGDKINMDKIHELLKNSTIKGEGLIDHAEGLSSETIERIEGWKPDTEIPKIKVIPDQTHEYVSQTPEYLEVKTNIDKTLADVYKTQADLAEAKIQLGTMGNAADDFHANNPESHEEWANLTHDADQQGDIVKGMESKLAEAQKLLEETKTNLKNTLTEALKVNNYPKIVEVNLSLARIAEDPVSNFTSAVNAAEYIDDNSKKLGLLNSILKESMDYEKTEFTNFRDYLLKKIGMVRANVTN